MFWRAHTNVSQSVTKLRALDTPCDFGLLVNEIIRDWLINNAHLSAVKVTILLEAVTWPEEAAYQNCSQPPWHLYGQVQAGLLWREKRETNSSDMWNPTKITKNRYLMKSNIIASDVDQINT